MTTNAEQGPGKTIPEYDEIKINEKINSIDKHLVAINSGVGEIR